MKVCVLSSGSKGNTTYIECGNTKILIDAGNCCKYITDKLNDMGIKGNEIDAIFMTHTHSDHIKGLRVFVNKFNPLIFVTKDMLVDLDYISNYSIIAKNEFNFKDIDIEVIKTSHDAPGSVGYVFSSNGKSIVYITDTGYIREKDFDTLKNKTLYVFESNHDVEKLMDNPNYPHHVKIRILSDKGHLSNIDSSKYMAKFIGSNTKYVVLSHLSEQNNTEDLAISTLKNTLKEKNIDFNCISVARQNEKTEIFDI